VRLVRPLSEVGFDQFLRQLDHRRHVAEINLLPAGVRRGGSQSGGSTRASRCRASCSLPGGRRQDGLLTASMLDGRVSVGGSVISLLAWSIFAIAAGALLSPVLAFLMAITVEIVIGVLKDAGMPALLTVVAVGAIGWLLLCKLRGGIAGEA
jgi:hypothetical protein